MSSQWPELMPDEDHGSRRVLLISTLTAVVGGAAGWSLVFLGLGLGGLAVRAVLVIALATLAHRLHQRRLVEWISISAACCLLTWPVLWFVVVFVRFWLTGKTTGA